MLRSLKDLEKYTISATDGNIGTVENFLLDDEHWTIRYLVAQTGSFFDERRVLISPISFRQADWTTRQIHVALTMDRIKKSPSVDTDKPVSRQHEQEFYRHYGYPYYWGYSGIWGLGAFPGLLTTGRLEDVPPESAFKPGDAHLRSASEVRGYHIQGVDEAIGHVEDFIVDDESWEIRYLVVNTSNWWLGKNVLVSPRWATRISWEEGKVYLGMSRQAVKNCPEWLATTPINREYEARLYDYYGRPVYWEAGHQPVPVPQAKPTEQHTG